MGVIRESSSGELKILEADHTIGRLPNSSLVLKHDYISKRHAILHYSGERWEVRDLGSRNGTYLNGELLKPGEDMPVGSGARLAFGRTDQAWEFVDTAPPVAMVVPLGEGEPLLMEEDMLALPSADNPIVTIYANASGAWVLEQPDSITEIQSQQTFEVDKKLYRFSCPDKIGKTALAEPLDELEVQHLHLTFSVTRDEEFVHLRVTCGAHQFDLGSRQHNYLLLTLARRRRDDAAEGTPETACGWIYLEDLAHDPSMAPPQLNVDVFRIRKQFAAIGVIDAANVVERRPRTKQIRLGAARCSIITV